MYYVKKLNYKYKNISNNTKQVWQQYIFYIHKYSSGGPELKIAK